MKFADKPPRVGDWVVAVGNPFGLGGTVTAGIVSAQGRDIGSGPYDYMQIDAAVNRGNSGGPTFNLDGEVVGVNTAIYSPSGGNVGIAFAVPAKTATRGRRRSSSRAARSAAAGSASRSRTSTRTRPRAWASARPRARSSPRSRRRRPAAEAGLKNGDAILAVNGNKVADSRDLARQIAELRAQHQGRCRRSCAARRSRPSPSSSASSPSGKELAKVESQQAGRARRRTEMEQLGLTVAPGTGAEQGRRGRHRRRQRLRCRPEGHQVGRRHPRGRRRSPCKTPTTSPTASRRPAKLGRKAVLMRIKSGEQTRFVAVQLKKS